MTDPTPSPLHPSVWAPDADRVELVVYGDKEEFGRAEEAEEAEEAEDPSTGAAGGQAGGPAHWTVSLERRPRGWWTAPEPLPPGTDYRFLVDGEGPFPDPRSRRQPDGVHGPSRTVDHEAFRWTDTGWKGFHLPSAVLYELHPGTFTPEGTLDAAVQRLDHLVELGVTAVSLMPVNAFPGRHGWGYDGTALWAVHEPYGGPEALKRFIDACHGRGLGVILDVVYNHLGPDGNYLGQYGPYFTDHYHTPWGEAVNFDQHGSDGVRDFVIGNAVAWLRDYHLDGLRIDAVHAIYDNSAVHVLEALAERIGRLRAELGRPLWLIPESDLNDPRLLRSRDAHGYGLDAQWSDDFHHALHAALTGEQDGYYRDFGGLGPVAEALERAWVYRGQHSDHRGRRHGREPEGLEGWRFLGYLQNHDQVGNRARGDRMSQLVPDALLHLGAALVLTSPFVPMLFQGEEWGASTPFQYFTDHGDPELGDAVRRGRRSEFAAFGWDPEQVPDPQDPQTFRRSRLDWEEPAEAPHAGLLDWHRKLIALRRRAPELTDGRLDRVRTRVDGTMGTLVVRRGRILVACNLSGEARVVRAPEREAAAEAVRDGGGPSDRSGPGAGAAGPEGAPEVLLASAGPVREEDGGWRLPPRSVAVLGPAELGPAERKGLDD